MILLLLKWVKKERIKTTSQYLIKEKVTLKNELN